MKLKFICLASGSSGNCFYLGTEDYGILIDAGIPVRTIKGALKDVGIDFDRIMGVFVTHDHADHIKSLGGSVGKTKLVIVNFPSPSKASILHLSISKRSV